MHAGGNSRRNDKFKYSERPRFVPTKISNRSFECCNVHRGQDINHRKSTRIQVDASPMPTGWNDGFEGHREF